MQKYEINIFKTKKISDRNFLLERMNIISDFKYPLIEEEDKNFYKQKLNESYDNLTFNQLVEHFAIHNKLTGKLNEDKKYLKEFALLLEDDEFDPFGHLQVTDKINEKEDCILRFGKGNAKIKHPYFSLPAAYTCPFADICKSFVDRNRKTFKSSGQKIMDTGDIRCYAASAELAYPAVQKHRWENFDLLQDFKGDIQGMSDLIERSFDYFGKNYSVFRIHESGDFFSQEYFDAWLDYIKKTPEITFYAYTKALPFWVARLDEIPSNFKLNASRGGKADELIDKYGLKNVTIVNTPKEAKELGLPIDVNDELAYKQDGNFALLLHGIQSKKSGLNPQAIKNQKLLKQMKQKIR